MKRRKWMTADEVPRGSWAVFLGENGPRSAKITGRLFVTDRHVYFRAGMRLDPDAGLQMGGGSLDYHADVEPPFQVLDEVVRFPRARIRRVTASRQWWILHSLHLGLDDGSEWTFRFGAFSPRRAIAALGMALKKHESA